MNEITTFKRSMYGDLLVRRMSEKAQKAKAYEEIFVYADDENAVDNIQVDDWESLKTVTFDELEKLLEGIADSWENE